MRSAKKSGIVRRPLEYLLLTVVGLLIAVLVYANMVIGRDEGLLSDAVSAPAQQYTGTPQEIDSLTQADLLSEAALLKTGDQTELTAADQAAAAADHISGVYDESLY